MKLLPREVIRSLQLAPLTAVPIVVLWGLGSSNAGIGADIVSGLVFAMLGLPIAYVATLVVGLPVYLILKRFDLHRLWIMSVIGFTLPLVIAWDPARPDMALMFATVGLAIAASSCMLQRWRPGSASL